MLNVFNVDMGSQGYVLMCLWMVKFTYVDAMSSRMLSFVSASIYTEYSCPVLFVMVLVSVRVVSRC